MVELPTRTKAQRSETGAFPAQLGGQGRLAHPAERSLETRPTPEALASNRTAALAEARALRRIAWPLIIGNLGTVAIQVTDTMMIGRLGPVSLAAVGLAGHLSLVVSLLCTGAVEAVAPLVAGERGRSPGDNSGIVSCVRHGLVLGLLMCIPLCALLWDTRWAFELTGQEAEVARIGSGYLQIFLFAIPAMVVTTALRGFVVGMELSRLVLYVSGTTVAVNFLGNWIFIYGKLGAPAMGANGAALSSVLASVFSIVWFMVLIKLAPQLRGIRLVASRWSLRAGKLLDVAKLGVPIGLILLVEIAFFAAVAVLMGRFGVDQLAAHQVAVQMVALSLMVPLAIGQAATVRVALFDGSGDDAGARLASLVPLWATSAVMIGLGLLLWVGAPLIVRAFLGADAPTTYAATCAQAVTFLRIAAVFQIVDGLQATAAGVLRGFRDTMIPLLMASFSYWIVGIPLVLLLSQTFGLEGRGVWIGMSIALLSCALSMIARIVQTLMRST